MDGYLNNLANAATQEKTTLAQLIENNTSLTSTVASLTAGLASLTTAYTLLANGPPPAASAAKNAPRSASSKFEPCGYCWTHGYKLTKGHSSATCSNKADGHKDTATRANTMGGSKRNKDWDA